MAFPVNGVKPQLLLNKMVEIYVGDPANLPAWWYVADGRTQVTMPDGTKKDIPDLRGFFALTKTTASNSDIMNTLAASVGKPRAWGNTEQTTSSTGKHTHNVNTNGYKTTVNIKSLEGTHNHTANWDVSGSFFRDTGQWVDQDGGTGTEAFINANYTNISTAPTAINLSIAGSGSTIMEDGHGAHTHNINAAVMKLDDTTTHNHTLTSNHTVTAPSHIGVYLVVYMGSTL